MLGSASRTASVNPRSLDLITMNEKPMGITTELGKKWELWQAFRELWCNLTNFLSNPEENSSALLRGRGSPRTFIESSAGGRH